MCAKIFLLTLIKLTEPGPPSIHPNNANFDLPRRQIKRRTRGENKLTSPAACPSIVVPSCRLTVLRVSTTQVVVENGKVCGEKRLRLFTIPSLLVRTHAHTTTQHRPADGHFSCLLPQVKVAFLSISPWPRRVGRA